MKTFGFCIEKCSYITSEEQIDVSFIPPIIRRRLSLLDKIALTTTQKVFEDSVEEIVFSSQYGEFVRLNDLIKEYQEIGETSPTKFSVSVHNYPVSFFTLYKKLNLPYYALSAGENSFASGLIKSIGKHTLYTYADTYDGIKSISCIISPSQNDIKISGESLLNITFEEFIDMLKPSFFI